MNGEKATFTYNDANQITTKNETAYTYDADGNLLQDEHYKYTYSDQQRLTKVTTLDDQTIASYTYDENGLRLTKTIGDKTHEYFYNDEVLEMEVVKVKDVVTEYRSYEWSGYTPLGMIIKKQNESGTFETNAYQFITNHRGDVLSIRDSEDKEVANYTYDAYGNELTATGDLAKANPIRYAGYYYDEETKNYYLQARYYNPANGAFLALDPHPGDDDEPLSQNGYSYANGNPVMNVDPDGEWAFLWWMAKGALLGGFVSYIQYEVEVRLGIQKRSKSNAIAKVSFGALSGAVLGGIGVSARGIKHVKGLLKIAKKKKYLSKKELKIANYIIYGQYNLLKKVVNHFNTTPGKRSWKDVIYSNSKKYF
ncbi:hypothetical protein DF281_11535 [Kurthia zopfii]|uniref:Cell wall-associated polypeptide CWBP200 n=1 Tax=Kurthia zopfii TaxID=1650 RepID=A0A8B4QA90_9BACL|nr:hypothetical protein DF281_11535 [Kurthia zopfii]TDR34967.1 RHS repeat-associated protein [Kurthia zopfii]STX09643.1 Cell wall-associated polypeptide CWBP200 [Kurthia zopfii]